mmetsp:Transcript_11354/g.19828  ORF Transcript_11354/g.19828 Transcript_11354/m.19828 type:complete len:200 (+) Transcript_11354:335-934(+)
MRFCQRRPEYRSSSNVDLPLSISIPLHDSAVCGNASRAALLVAASSCTGRLDSAAGVACTAHAGTCIGAGEAPSITPLSSAAGEALVHDDSAKIDLGRPLATSGSGAPAACSGADVEAAGFEGGSDSGWAGDARTWSSERACSTTSSSNPSRRMSRSVAAAAAPPRGMADALVALREEEAAAAAARVLRLGCTDARCDG